VRMLFISHDTSEYSDLCLSRLTIYMSSTRNQKKDSPYDFVLESSDHSYAFFFRTAFFGSAVVALAASLFSDNNFISLGV
jgi:hypothetical protein